MIENSYEMADGNIFFMQFLSNILSFKIQWPRLRLPILLPQNEQEHEEMANKKW